MKLKSISLCALLLTSILFLGIPEPAVSEEEFPELPPRPFTELPDIESYGVWPETGWNDTTFSFYLNATLDYFWNETIPRLEETVRVYIDSIPYEMHENNTRDTNWTDGKQFYWMNENRLWSKGFHDYFFYVEINESSNMTDTGQFEIYNRAPYMLEGPFGKIYTTDEFEFEFRATDEDMDPLTWTLTTNMTENDYSEFETEQLNTSFKLKIKCTNGDWIRWFKIVVHDPYDNEAYWRWEVYCLENEIPGRDPRVPRNIGGGPHFTRGVGDSQSTPNDGPFHNTDFYWVGDGNNWLWDDSDNWMTDAGGVWARAAPGEYPKDNGDRAFFNETANFLYLVHGANSVVTIGELKLSAGFTGYVTMSIDLIIDNAAAHDGHMEVSSGTWDVNTSNEQINLDGYLHLLDTGTFVERAGIVIVQGSGVVQQIRVQDTNELYRFVLDSPVTVAEIYDNLTVFQITIGTGTTYSCDANTRGYELWTNYTDAAGCGFVSTSAGTLNLIGTATYKCNITTADAAPPPTNYWTGATAHGFAVTADYTTFSYGNNLGLRGATDIDDCTFDNMGSASASYAFNFAWDVTVTSFTDNTISNTIGHGFYLGADVTNIDNLVMTAIGGSSDIVTSSNDGELVNSNFDVSAVTLGASGNIISSVHNDVANAYKIMATTLSKSTITNDFTASDKVTVISGTFTIDENANAYYFYIDSGARVTHNTATTFDIDTNLTVNGTLESSGTITHGHYWNFYNNGGSIWLNNSTVSNAELAYRYGGFNFSVGKDANSTIDDFTFEAPATQNVAINFTSIDFSKKLSGVIYHYNATASSGTVKTTVSNLTASTGYDLYVDDVLNQELLQTDASGVAYYEYDDWSTKWFYLIYIGDSKAGGGQYDRWIVGFEYSKNFFTNEVHFTASFNYSHRASWYIWDFDGAIYESASPNISHTFAFSIYSVEDVKLTIIATDGNRYWMESPIILDNTLWIALLILTVISLAAIAILQTRRARRRTELVMVEHE